MLVCQKYFKILDVDAEPPCHGNSSLVFVFSNVYAFVSYIVFVFGQYIKILGADAWSPCLGHMDDGLLSHRCRL